MSYIISYLPYRFNCICLIFSILELLSLSFGIIVSLNMNIKAISIKRIIANFFSFASLRRIPSYIAKLQCLSFHLLAFSSDCFASVLFGESEWKNDLGISVPMLLNSSSFPIDLPRAEAYLMSTEDGKRRLEDRFNTADLWIAMTLRGRWIDVEENTLWISRLTHRHPQSGDGETRTRSAYYSSLPKFKLDKESKGDQTKEVLINKITNSHYISYEMNKSLSSI